MTEEQLVEKFLQKPARVKNGAGYLAKQWNTSVEAIKTAREKAKKLLIADKKAITSNYISALEEEVTAKITEQKSDRVTGEDTLTIVSSKPLSPKEIDELAQVDNISSFVKMTWLKSNVNDKWTYSIQRVNTVKDFYNAGELNKKLKEIFGTMTVTVGQVKHITEIEDFAKENGWIKREELPIMDKALFVYIGDDHCGLILQESLFKREYSGKTYAQRLLQVSEEIKSLKQTFQEIYVVRGGDEMDGYNNKTTRQDHELSASSNKEQFDIYTIANKLFYDDLFTSGRALSYKIINLNNSNHSGSGFSYIANRALEFWLEAKFPQVSVIHQNKFIDSYTFGNHVISLTHGKDEKYMKSPMPLNLDYKTDLWLMEYHKNVILNGSWVSTIKFDMHKHNVNQGKSGRYIGVPSISSGSNWIEHNYGDSEPGALLEIYTPDSKNITSIPIWFN